MNEIIIIFSILLLLAYIFDLTSSKTRVPSVILLLLLGWTVREVTYFSGILLPDLSFILPFLGTLGLILIVLEGSLDLELNRSKIGLITKSFLGALFPMIALSFLLAYLFSYFGQYSFKDSLLNAIPFCVISSAIAIPSVRNISNRDKEFVIYESSLSDILGVLFFTFISINEVFNLRSFGYFGFQMAIMMVISFIATVGLSFLLSKIQHHIKFVPIIVLIIAIYAISKIYHLPALIFILLFGLFIGNLDEFKRFQWFEKFKPEILNREVMKFKELAGEASFLVRSLFFLLFGYLLETNEILNTETLVWALGIVFLMFAFRAIQLKLSKLSLTPLLFIAPRGLITILLFLSIEPTQRILLVNKSLIIQVIVITALIMMIGLLATKKNRIVKAHQGPDK